MMIFFYLFCSSLIAFDASVRKGFRLQGSYLPFYGVLSCARYFSAGLLIFISGVVGKRTLTPNTSILSHQFSWGSWGKEHELFAAVKEFDLTTKRMIKHYKKCTGLTDKEIRKFLLPPQDIWLDGKEAKKLGICDRVQELY